MGAPELIGYPCAPINGGKLGPTTPRKVGEWVWQPKVDGWRGVVHVPTGTVWSQYGELSSIANKFQPALTTLRERCAERIPSAEWLDVELMNNRHELMRGCIIVLDCMCWPDLPLMGRRAGLRAAMPVLPFDMADLLGVTGGQIRDAVFLISEWDNGIAPEKLDDFLQHQNKFIGRKFYEGLVAKRANSFYRHGSTPKTPTSNWIKHRFDQ